jgi:signal peptidase I
MLGSRVFRLVVELVLIIVVAMIASFLIQAFLVQPFTVPTGSMVHTIEENDRILSEKISNYTGDYTPGNIVTFNDPMGEDRVLVKRLIAVEGQVIDLRDGHLYVDNALKDEAYTNGEPSYPLNPTFNNKAISYPYTIPSGYVWVMGDNRTHSADSRYFGPIAREELLGKAFFCYFPFDRFGFLS